MTSETNSEPKAEALVASRDDMYAAESQDYLSEAGSANSLNADVLGGSASSNLGYNSMQYLNNNQLNNNQLQQRQLLQQQLRRQQLIRQQQQLQQQQQVNSYMTGTGLRGNNQLQQRMALAGNRRVMALAGNNGYGNFGYGNIDRGGGGGGGSFLNGINFLSGDFDVGIDGDLLLAGIAAAAAAFFYAVYGAITAGRKKRSTPLNSNTGMFPNRISSDSGILPTWLSGLFGPALEAIGVTGDSDEVLNRIANSVVNPTSQWLQPEKSDDKGMP